MRKIPLIGIVADYVCDGNRARYSPMPWYVVRENYIQCVAAHGGQAILIPYHQPHIPDLVERLDGVLLIGSDGDVVPALYGHTLHPTTQPSRKRSFFEIEVARCALERKKPFLGICNGMQILNIALGGSLFQDIPSLIPNALEHRLMGRNPYEPAHPITVLPNSILAYAQKARERWVNTGHHQSVMKLGQGLMVSARCPTDDVIEAIELIHHPFTLGVQWHPEYLVEEGDSALFKSFVEACADEYS